MMVVAVIHCQFRMFKTYSKLDSTVINILDTCNVISTLKHTASYKCMMVYDVQQRKGSP